MKASPRETWDDNSALRREQKIIRIGGTVGFVGTIALCVWLAVMARIDENAVSGPDTDADTTRTEVPSAPIPPPPADSTAQNLF